MTTTHSAGDSTALHAINDGHESDYLKFVRRQNIPVFSGFYMADVNDLPLGWWERKGANASFVHLDGAGEVNNGYVCEIPPGGSTKEDRHMYEELVHITSGQGATTIRNGRGHETTFEWSAGSLFSIPLNTTYRHHNGRGDVPVRYYAVTSMPLMINLVHDENFIFGLDYDFTDRFGSNSHYGGEGQAFADRVWETNFIADVAAMSLHKWEARGSGSSNIMLELADNSLCAHISEFPVGTYKKAHRHGAGAHVVILAGEGYSLLWEEGSPVQRVDWRPGSVVAPPDQWFHQHFNLSAAPARYLAMRWGSVKHPTLTTLGVDRPLAEGGNQIEYEDEDPSIRATFVAELAARGIAPRGVTAEAAAGGAPA